MYIFIMFNEIQFGNQTADKQIKCIVDILFHQCRTRVFVLNKKEL